MPDYVKIALVKDVRLEDGTLYYKSPAGGATLIKVKHAGNKIIKDLTRPGFDPSAPPEPSSAGPRWQFPEQTQAEAEDEAEAEAEKASQAEAAESERRAVSEREKAERDEQVVKAEAQIEREKAEAAALAALEAQRGAPTALPDGPLPGRQHLAAAGLVTVEAVVEALTKARAGGDQVPGLPTDGTRVVKLLDTLSVTVDGINSGV